MMDAEHEEMIRQLKSYISHQKDSKENARAIVEAVELAMLEEWDADTDILNMCRTLVGRIDYYWILAENEIIRNIRWQCKKNKKFIDRYGLHDIVRQAMKGNMFETELPPEIEASISNIRELIADNISDKWAQDLDTQLYQYNLFSNYAERMADAIRAYVRR
jgi:hypothetical protein